MNILPKKKWHVRTKENVARVRRDEAKAAEEELRKSQRAALAEQESRTGRLRMQAEERVRSQFDIATTTVEAEKADKESDVPIGPTHVNFFADLETEERKNLGNEGNLDREAEKAEEKKSYESKMGILKYLGEGSSEYTKTVPWYQKPPEKLLKPDVKIMAKPDLKRKELPVGMLDFGTAQKKIKKLHKHDRSHKKKKKHRRQSSSSESDGESEEQKREKLLRLRRERLLREQAESDKAKKLLQPKKEEPKPQVQQKYNSQFNPDFARQNQKNPSRPPF